MKNSVITKVEADKELQKNLKKLNHYSNQQFIDDAKKYISAIKQRRMLCIIKSVSSTGMSRVIKFNSCEAGRDKNSFWYRQYICLFIMLGYGKETDNGGFRINGCGMDMIFHTNYSIIHQLTNLGFLTKSECATLCQMTPTVL